MSTFGDFLSADTLDGVITTLEAFRDHFKHLATTPEQQKLAGQFSAFLGELHQAILTRGERELHPRRDPEREHFLTEHGHESLAELFQEIRADEAAARRADAHRYGKETLQQIRSERTVASAAEQTKDAGIER